MSVDLPTPIAIYLAAGKLFKRSVKMYVYPTRDASGKILTFDVLDSVALRLASS